ncbi:MAG: hypothetical protein PHQ75_04405 [Thermoguttaceae bacterium]|nr:hypothetical protein [Thermoguttaceae bacterium]
MCETNNNSPMNDTCGNGVTTEHAGGNLETASKPTIQDSQVGQPSSSSRFWDGVHCFLAFSIVCGVLFYLIKTPTGATFSAAAHSTLDIQSDVVILPNGDIQFESGSSLLERLHIETVSKVKTKDPLFEVSGSVLGSYRPQGSEYQWQFSSPTLLTLYTDWQKSVNDVAFYTRQLASTKELAETKTIALSKQFERKKKLVKIGTDTKQDLASTEAELLQVQIEERKNIYEAETAVTVARKTESTFLRQLEQCGLNPRLLDSTAKDHDVIRANIPGSFFDKVSVGLECRASFQDFPSVHFTGTIREIIPVLSQEFGTLCVLFVVNDPKDFLRPGMFTDVGIGTEEREILVVSPESILHIGDSDFVLARKHDSLWSVRKVKAGNVHTQGMEIVHGLAQGEQVAGQGVILLKGYVSEALAQVNEKTNTDRMAQKQSENTENKTHAAPEATATGKGREGGVK